MVPTAYRLDLTLDPAQPRFSGEVEIDAVLAAPSDHIFLHGRDLAMQTATATAGGKPFPGEWVQRDTTGVAELRFASPLPAGPITLSFRYDAPFNDSPAGLYRVKVGDDWYSWSQFESIDARGAFPSFDQPGFKTPFAITLRTPPGLKAVSNTREVSVRRQGTSDVHRFAPTAPLPTYLVAMMTGPFTASSDEIAPTPQRAQPLPLRIVSTRQNADRLDFALSGSQAITIRLEDYFGEAFPFPKLDQITSPIMPGAMENAAAAVYGDAILVLDDKAPLARQRRFGMVVAHELAHQWFGDLVSPAWWDDIWLNESFANWLGYRIAAEWRPDLKIAAGARAEGFAAMDIDALTAGRAIRQAITANSQIDSSFDAITYGKGGQVVAMIASYMGDERFRAGVRRYMAAHRFGNATSDDFFAALATEAGDDRLLAALRSFTDQQGVPLLTFAERGTRITVSQSRYLPLGITAPPTRWIVPLCLRRGAARHCMLMGETAETIELPGKGPVIPNFDGSGYYRFELQSGAWQELISAADRLPAGEALAAADSLLASFRAGRSPATRLVAMARQLSRNPDSYALDAAADLLDGLTGAELVNAAAAPAYRSMVARIFWPLLRKLGFDPRWQAGGRRG